MGSGFRTFTAGEVLTASNVQNYLMDQSVMTFGGSATRASAIGTANFEEGMVSYLTDTDKMEVYNGTNWVSVAPTASTPMGVLINSTSFSGVSSVSLPANTFTSAYKNYQYVLKHTNSAESSMIMRMRASGSDNSSNNYKSSIYTQQYSNANDPNTGVGSVNLVSSFQFGYGYASFPTYVTGVFFEPYETAYTSFIYNGLYLQNATTGGYGQFGTGGMSVTTSYDSATILASTGTITGSISIYGVNA